MKHKQKPEILLKPMTTLFELEVNLIFIFPQVIVSVTTSSLRFVIELAYRLNKLKFNVSILLFTFFFMSCCPVIFLIIYSY